MPDDKTRRLIWRGTREAVAASGGRPVSVSNLHVTVAFLGNVDMPALQQAVSVGPFATGPFELQLGRVERRARARVLWLAPTAVPAALLALEESLWRQLVVHGFGREDRPYRPHMTLARNAGRVDAEALSLRWRVSELALVESVPSRSGRRYEALATWRL
jgi:2'-5' RNA ligase